MPLKTALLGSSPGLNTGNEKKAVRRPRSPEIITAPSFQTHQFQLRTEEHSKLDGDRKEKESVAIYTTYYKFFPDGRKRGKGEAFMVTRLESGDDRV